MNKEFILPAFYKYKLGQISSIEFISGGDVNFNYKVITDVGVYDVKIMEVDSYFKLYHMKKNQLIFSLDFSEEVAAIANQQGIPAVCAILLDQHRFIEIKNKIVLIYPFVAGQILSEDNITDNCIMIIAELLANQHQVAYSHSLLELAKQHHDGIKSIALKLLREKIWQHADDMFKQSGLCYLYEKLHEVSDAASSITESLSQSVAKDFDLVICHNDLKPKNTLWFSSHPNIIDWEGAGYMPKMVDYLDTMISWCAKNTTDALILDINKCNAFASTYRKIANTSEITNDVINILIVKWLAWLAFCLAKLRLNPNMDIAKQEKLINYALNYLNFIFKNSNELLLFG